MFNHIFIGTNAPARAKSFYVPVMAALGHEVAIDLPHGTAFPTESGTLIVATPADGEATTCMNGFTFGFRAKDYAMVDAFHAAGLANGGTDEGAPGVREQSPGRKYGAYLRDPDGHKICAFAPNADA